MAPVPPEFGHRPAGENTQPLHLATGERPRPGAPVACSSLHLHGGRSTRSSSKLFAVPWPIVVRGEMDLVNFTRGNLATFLEHI